MRKRRRAQIRHLGVLLLIDEDVARSHVTDIPPVRLEIPLGCDESVEEVPEVCLLEIFLFWSPSGYFIPEVDGKMRVCILDNANITRAVPVVLHISLSGVKPVCSGSSRN